MSDDFLTAGDQRGAEGETFGDLDGQSVVVGVRPFDGGPLGPFVWSPPFELQV